MRLSNMILYYEGRKYIASIKRSSLQDNIWTGQLEGGLSNYTVAYFCRGKRPLGRLKMI
jgi:hypothetical protein